MAKIPVIVNTTYGIIGTKCTKQTPQKLPENPHEMKLIFRPSTNAIGGSMVGETIIKIINFLNLKFINPNTLAAGRAMIIDTTVTISPIVTLFTSALIIVGLESHKSKNPSKDLYPSLGINLSLTQAC